MKMTKMIGRVSLLVLISFLSTFSALAQKVKYKDLIVLLTSKQYEKAEPFLKRYLRENNDNPNAFLFMGMTFQEKSSKMDPLMHTDILCANIDSAILFYDKAHLAINDKELRRNDEYYEAYTQRDLRTGKFVIKLSTVLLDIETRTAALKERRERIKQLKFNFDESSKKYARANAAYKSIQSTYETEKEFFLRADDEILTSLKNLGLSFDSAVIAFNRYKVVSKELGKTGYNQLVDLQEIKDLKRDGSSPADFMKDDLRLWDYKRWADQASNTIVKEIYPMRDNLVAYDIEVNKLREKLRTDSVAVKSDLTKLVDKMLSDQLKKYDPDPLPLDVFAMKIAELTYHSDMILHKPMRDSSNVRHKLTAIKIEIKDLKKLDSLASQLGKRNFDDEEKDYRHFITKVFGSTAVLKSTISTTQEYAIRERLKKEKEWEVTSQLLKWIVVAPDSIPLFTETNRDLKYKPLVIQEEKFTFGLAYRDSLQAAGYFYTITPSRQPELKVNFAVDKANFKKSRFSLFKGLFTSDGSGNAYIVLIYSTQKSANKFPATIAKIYRADGLAWNINFGFDLTPSEVILNSDTGDISVKLTGADGEAKIKTFDKSGKPKN